MVQFGLTTYRTFRVTLNDPFEINSIAIYNIQGKEIEHFETLGNEIEFDLSKYGSSIYILKLLKTKETYYFKLVVQDN
jgi:hypothetical protein